MNRIQLIFILATLSFGLASRASGLDSQWGFEPQKYNVPKSNSYLLSFYAGSYSGDKKRSRVIKTQILEKPFKKLKYRLFEPEVASNSIVYIIGGLGATIDSNISLFLAEQMSRAGAHAVILPNTMTKDFLLTGSRSGVVGLSNQDAADVLAIIKKIDHDAFGSMSNKKRKIMGYSHGALLSAHLMAQDSFYFDSALFLNPPVDLLYGLQLLDQQRLKSKEISFKKLIGYALNLPKKFKKYALVDLSKDNFESFIAELNLNESEAPGLIGLVMSSFLRSVIEATDDRGEFGLLPERAPSGSVLETQVRRKRSEIANRYSFTDYVEKILIPFGPSELRQLSIEQINQMVSLKSALQLTQRRRALYLIHNEDDFLLRENDIQYLKSFFGKNAVFFETGGHLGNIGHPQVLHLMRSWLTQ